MRTSLSSRSRDELDLPARLVLDLPARLVHPDGAVRLVDGWPTQSGSR